MNLSCIIVEDEPYAASLLEEYLANVHDCTLEAKYFNARDVLAHFENHRPDLVFMDINLPKLSGIELAKLLPFNQKVIFTTAYAEYALESYSVNTIDYLLKPITLERFLKCIEKARAVFAGSQVLAEANAASNRQLFVKSGKSILKINFDQIVLIEGLKDYVLFHTASDKHIVYKKMKDLENSLPGYFKRVHHSFIINTHQLEKIEHNHVYLGKKTVAIGEKYRASFLSYVKRYSL